MILINDREAVHITNDETEVDRQLLLPPSPLPPHPPQKGKKGWAGGEGSGEWGGKPIDSWRYGRRIGGTP